MAGGYHRYVVVCEDGSREEVVAEGYSSSYEPGIGEVVKFEPTTSYKGGPQGRFVRPQGIHRTEKWVVLPVGEGEPDEDDG